VGVRGLYEYLSVEAPLGVPWGEQSRDTRTDGETVDDDFGLSEFGIPRNDHDQSTYTFSRTETVDDDAGLDAVRHPTAQNYTVITRVDGETVDDDGLSDLLGP